MDIGLASRSTLLVSAAFLGIASVAAAQDQTPAAAEEEPTEYLVSIAAGAGAVLEPGERDGCYTLTLEDADHVTWFSDRPKREAFSEHAHELAEDWEGSFADSAPNADLEMFREDGSSASVVLELNEAPVWNVNDRTLTFAEACEVPVDTGGSEAVQIAPEIQADTFPMASLFIDGASTGTLYFLNCTSENWTYYVFNGGDIFCLVPRQIKVVDADGGTNSSKCNFKKDGCIIFRGDYVSFGSCSGSGLTYVQKGYTLIQRDYSTGQTPGQQTSC